MKSVVHTPTKEQWEKVLQVLDKQGKKWANLLFCEKQWSSYKEESCICFNDKFGVSFGSKGYYEGEENYKTLSFDQFMEEEGGEGEATLY